MTGVPGRLGQKVAVVTGGGSGIGRAAAIRFAGEGARVLVADIDAGHADAVAGEISAAGGRAAAWRSTCPTPRRWRRWPRGRSPSSAASTS